MNVTDYEVLEIELVKIKHECQNTKDCKGCRFYSASGCKLRFIPEDWKIDKTIDGDPDIH